MSFIINPYALGRDLRLDSLFWFRGDTVTLGSGTEVTTWPDKADGTANDATTVASRNTPNLLTSQINSRDVVDFTATSSEILELAAISGIVTYTTYIVFKADITSSGVRSFLSQIQNSGGTFLNQGFNIFINAGILTFTNRDGSGTQSKTFAFTDVASYHILMVKFESVGAGTSKLLVKLDGLTMLTFTNLNGISANNNKLYIGALLGAGADDFDGKFAEIIFFQEYHSNSQQSSICNNLINYYNFSFDWYDDGYTGATTTENMTYSSSIDSISNLHARVSYRDVQEQPICILMHGLGQAASDFLDSTLIRFAEIYGYFTAAVGMRGRDGASGTNDASGRELFDIYDAITYIRSNYSTKVSQTRVIIVGYSGGGGNVLGMASRFPDLAVLYVDFFGISDYGYDGTFSYYVQTPGQQANLQTWVGGTPAAVPNEYKSRQFMWSASNCKGKLRMYHDLSDSSVNVNHSQRTETQLIADSFTNYVYSQSQSGDPERWIHGLPNVGQTGQENIDAEDQFSGEGFSLSIPSMPTSGTLKINGYLKCSLFTIWLGNGTAAQDGKNRRGTLTYNYSTNSYTLVPALDSPATDMTYSFTDNIGRTSSGTISSSTPFTPT